MLRAKTFLNVFIKNILDLRRVLFMNTSVRFVTGTQIIFAYQNLKKISQSLLHQNCSISNFFIFSASNK